MAGSYQHCVNSAGQLERGIPLIENMGDAVEAIEAFYGMVWWLAQGRAAAVRDAAAHYRRGIDEYSPGIGDPVDATEPEGD